MMIDLDADPEAALRLIVDRDAWPTMRAYSGGRSPLSVEFRHAGDSELWFTPDAIRSDWLLARRVCAAAGPEAVAADTSTPEAVAAFRDRYGEFSSCYDLERWYAPFGGPRRRILAVLCPDRAVCEVECPAIPAEFRVVQSFEEASRPRPAAPAPNPAARRRLREAETPLFAGGV